MGIEEIIDQYSKLVYKICYDMLKSSLDAEDISQETFLSFYLNIDKYGSLPENEIKNIICRIALNKCKDVLKSKAQKLQNMMEDNVIKLENYAEENNIEEEIFKKQRAFMMVKMINELKEPYATILYQYYIEEKSLDEIVTQQQVSKATLKMQLHRGRKYLKEKLVSNGGENLL